MSILVPSLTRRIALDTEVVEATRQEYVLFLRAADGKITSIREYAAAMARGSFKASSIAVRGIDDV
jgi:ketosteroid isomerase-like protein